MEYEFSTNLYRCEIEERAEIDWMVTVKYQYRPADEECDYPATIELLSVVRRRDREDILPPRPEPSTDDLIQTDFLTADEQKDLILRCWENFHEWRKE